MKLLITGSRNFTDESVINELIRAVEKSEGKTVTLLLHGGAKGADSLAQSWAVIHNIPTKIILPDYTKHGGKAAPIIRNQELVKLADVTLALYADTKTGGTEYTAKQTVKAAKPLYEYLGGKLRYTPPALRLL